MMDQRVILSKMQYLGKILVTALTLLLLPEVSSRAQERVQFPQPGRYLIQELNSKRIVMLGDFQHENVLPFFTVTTTLNDWLDMVSSGEKVVHHLTLVLEEDDTMIHVLNDYISTGNMQPLIGFYLPTMTLDFFEFAVNLRHFCERVDSINQFLPNTERIMFDIYGEEVMGLKSNAGRSLFKASVKDTYHYFVSTRDSVNALKLERYLERHPLQKLLIFCGNAHLIEGYVPKAPSVVGPDTLDSKGYYLVHYLKGYYGEDSVLSIDQAGAPMYWNGIPYRVASDTIFFKYRSEMPVPESFFAQYDGVILRYESPPIPNHTCNLVFSRRVIEKCIEDVDTLQEYLPGYFARSYMDQALNALRLITGESFSTAQEWTAWYKAQEFDGLSRLESKALEEQLLNDFYQKFSDMDFRTELYNLGFGRGVLYLREPGSKEDWLKEWPAVQRRIELSNAIGIYWLGYPDEQREAHEWLVEHTGVDFPNAEGYLKWQRRSVYQATY